MEEEKVLVIIPAYNEQATITQVLSDVKKYFLKQIY
jgi:glycosyltransferase involved in cell wall biosynthesis